MYISCRTFASIVADPFGTISCQVRRERCRKWKEEQRCANSVTCPYLDVCICSRSRNHAFLSRVPLLPHSYFGNASPLSVSSIFPPRQERKHGCNSISWPPCCVANVSSRPLQSSCHLLCVIRTVNTKPVCCCLPT